MKVIRRGTPFRTTILLLLAALLLGGCSSWAERLWVNAPGWSRAARLGNTATREAVPLALIDDSIPVAVLIARDTDQPALVFRALNQDGSLRWERVVPAGSGVPNDRQLVWAGGALHAFWISHGELFHLQLTADGEPNGEPAVLPTTVPVAYFALAVSPSGELALWYSGSRSDPGLYAMEGLFSKPVSTLIDALAIRPSLQFDSQGDLHAGWLRYPSGFARDALYYAYLPQGVFDPARVSLVLDIDFPIAQVLNGPQMGIDSGRVYFAWAVEVRTGLSAGEIEARYLSFPIGQPVGQPTVEYLRVPSAFKLPYSPLPGQTGSWVGLPAADLGTTIRVFEVYFLPGQPERALAVFKAQTDYLRRKTQWQIGTLLFEQGAERGYELLSFTSSESTYARIVQDSQGDLYATWLEGSSSSGGVVYLASTAPRLRAAFNRLSVADITQMLAETLFGLASGMVLFWFPLIWLIGSLAVLFLTSPLRREDQPLLRPGTLISLALIVAAFWVVKLFVFPGMFAYVPFSAWIPVLPQSWYEPLRIATPVVIGLIALGTALHFTYQRDNRSPLYFTLIYGLVDGLLTLAVYGVIFWGDI